MKKFLLALLFWGGVSGVYAQECPPEWVQYTYGNRYLYGIEKDVNGAGRSEIDFKNTLLDMARTNLAKQVKVQVVDNTFMEKMAVNGRSSIRFSSRTDFSTDVNMELVQTKTLYSAAKREGWAIAYIDKAAAGTFYKNKVEVLLRKADNTLTNANNYIISGFKGKASDEAKAMLAEFAQLDEIFYWLSFFGLSQGELGSLLDRCSTRQQALKKLEIQVKNGIVVYLSCQADLFGRPYPNLQSKLKGALASEKHSFSDDPDGADWVIEVNAEAREFNITGESISTFHAKVDAFVKVVKTATGQHIFEDEITVKGSHTRGYEEAARIAYKDLESEITARIRESINE
ncbi:MAG: LPP20 family lipoprotein [Bacteroides sp.]|nr:LPP20 family lipoprotein [Bacteroides sp.]